MKPISGEWAPSQGPPNGKRDIPSTEALSIPYPIYSWREAAHHSQPADHESDALTTAPPNYPKRYTLQHRFSGWDRIICI